MRFCLLLFLFIVIAGTSQAGTGKDLAPGSYMLKLDYGGEQDYKWFVIMK